jgi:hypothetical protein
VNLVVTSSTSTVACVGSSAYKARRCKGSSAYKARRCRPRVSPATTSDYSVNQNPGSPARISSRRARVIRLLSRREGRAGVQVIFPRVIRSRTRSHGRRVAPRPRTGPGGRGRGAEVAGGVRVDGEQYHLDQRRYTRDCDQSRVTEARGT